MQQQSPEDDDIIVHVHPPTVVVAWQPSESAYVENVDDDDADASSVWDVWRPCAICAVVTVTITVAWTVGLAVWMRRTL